MALKFLNKKGWHTGSLRNIENVWKAEQKHEAEQKKLEELRKQIQEERERSEFRLLQEQAGLVPKQERLEFLYDSGLAVGKGSSSGGFKALESFPPKTDFGTDTSTSASASSSNKLQQPPLPGALFEEKQQSSNDAWRKLHSDPLLLIRQREQEALSRVKNNPIQMANIRKSVEATKNKKRSHNEDDEAPRRKYRHKKKHEKHSSSKHHSDSENSASKERRKSSGRRGSYNGLRNSEDELSSGDSEWKSSSHKNFKYKDRQSSALPESTTKKYLAERGVKQIQNKDQDEETYLEGGTKSVSNSRDKRERRIPQNSEFDSSDIARSYEPLSRHRKKNPVKLSEEERSARLLEMQMDAEIHEEQRWKRLKKAEEDDVQEAVRAGISKGRSFLDDIQKGVYGTDKGGSSTIEESVRRRTHYLQGRSEATEGNAFHR